MIENVSCLDLPDDLVVDEEDDPGLQAPRLQPPLRRDHRVLGDVRRRACNEVQKQIIRHRTSPELEISFEWNPWPASQTGRPPV